LKDLITIICTANICRSPIGECLLKHALAAEPEPWKKLRVISAGIAAMTGERASPNSIVALKQVGLDINDHRAQQLTQEMIDESLCIFCMTDSHRELIQMNFDGPFDHVFLMREFIANGLDAQIPDPFGQRLEDYKNCRDSMVEAIPSIINYLKVVYFVSL
jgi:protein-tyrosine-phosphatase